MWLLDLYFVTVALCFIGYIGWLIIYAPSFKKRLKDEGVDSEFFISKKPYLKFAKTQLKNILTLFIPLHNMLVITSLYAVVLIDDMYKNLVKRLKSEKLKKEMESK